MELVKDMVSDNIGPEMGIEIAAGLLAATGVELPQWLTDFITCQTVCVTPTSVIPSLVLGINFDSGGYYKVDSIDKGTDVDVDSPVDVDVIYVSC